MCHSLDGIPFLAPIQFCLKGHALFFCIRKRSKRRWIISRKDSIYTSDLLPHSFKSCHISCGEQDALFPGHLVRHHVAALLCEKIARKRSARTVLIHMRDKEITRRNFALSRFFKNFDIVSDIPKQIFVVPVRPFGYFPAVHNILAV